MRLVSQWSKTLPTTSLLSRMRPELRKRIKAKFWWKTGPSNGADSLRGLSYRLIGCDIAEKRDAFVIDSE